LAKVAVYCFDFVTKEFVVKFEGIRPMIRELNVASNVQIYPKEAVVIALSNDYCFFS
jgi:hypothetical protein